MMKMNKNKTIKINIVVSGLIIGINIPCTFLNNKKYYILTLFFHIDLVYFIFSFILFVLSLNIKFKRKNKKQNRRK